MEEKDLKELNEDTRARGVKRASEIKIAEVSTGKKKRTKKPTTEATEPDIAQNLFELPFERTEAYEMRSRLGDAARDVAEGRLTLEEVTKAIQNAVRDYNIRLADRGAFYNPPEELPYTELDMEKFNRSAMAIARGKEKIAALIRNAKPLPPSNINNDTSNNNVEGTDPSSPIAEPPLLASTPHLAAMTPSRATEPPAVYRPLWEHILCSSHTLHLLASHSRPMDRV